MRLNPRASSTPLPDGRGSVTGCVYDASFPSRARQQAVLALGLLLLLPLALFSQPAADHRVHSLKIRILSTMLADTGIGEWGFSALVEADGHRILFDTGFKPDTVL